MKVHMLPTFRGPDNGDGGVRQVVEAQLKYFKRLGVQMIEDPGDADLLAFHITAPESYLKRFPDKPIVAHCHGLYWSEYEWEPWAYKANSEVLRLICAADITTAPSEWVANVLRRHTSRDIRVVPHGVDMREWQPAEDRGYVLWNKTRVDPVCDPDALNILAMMMPNQPFVSTFGEENLANLQLVGRVPYTAMKELVRHAGVYLCTTRETFGIGTIEAMSAGVPIVGYAYGAQTEYIEHGKTGWLVQPGDYPGLIEGILWARENRAIISERTRRKATDFSWLESARMYREIYAEALERHDVQANAPRTTIVVPAYKLDAYLDTTLQSVAEQTDKSWECIVVDDASPDRCGEIADSWAKKDARFRVIHNETNLYLAEARNVAIDQARGRFILPLDADDMLSPVAVQTLADALDIDKTLSVAYGSVFFTEEDGKTPSDYGIQGKTPGHSGWPVPFEPDKQVNGWNLLPYSSMFRREAWRLTGGYRRRLKTAEDADFWTRLASFGFQIKKVTDEDTLIYRNRPGSMSRANDQLRHNYLRWFPWAKDTTLAPAPLLGPKGVGLRTPRVSVVIPVGPGHERYVQDAVDSVMAQSYLLWECIVVNDSGSTLRLPTWVREIRCDARDVGAARNAGIAAALGLLYLPLDADDFLQPDALYWLVTAWSESGGGIIYPDFFEDPEVEGEWKAYKLPDWRCGDLTRGGCIHSIVALTPVDVWRQVGGYSEKTQWEDWDFQLRCAEIGVCSSRLAAPLFNYRKHTGKRRNWKDNDEFEERKGTILARWSDYFEGKKQFMACGCSSKTVQPSQQSQPMSRAQAAQTSEAILVEYIGKKAGTIRYRAPSKTIYTFAAGDPPKYVKGEDESLFVGLKDFRVVPSGNAALQQAADALVPVLV